LSYLHERYASFGMPIDSAGVRAAFQKFWPQCTRQFLKLETIFEYVEIDNSSWNAFAAGNLELSRQLLQQGLSRSIPFYERVRALGINSHRVRPLCWPLTRYMEWEFLSYEESIRHGQRISLYPAETDSSLVAAKVSDFILFDDFACLLHRYSRWGELEGAIVVEQREVVRKIAGIHAALAARAMPFHDAVEFGSDHRWHLRANVWQEAPGQGTARRCCTNTIPSQPSQIIRGTKK
jgi:hypothetical protein